MPIEFEYKYLVEKVPDEFVDRIDHQLIKQFYISDCNERKMSSRVRRVWHSNNNETNYIVTHKIGSGPSVMETEYKISEDVYKELREHFQIGEVIEKSRAVIELNDLCWDIDIFSNGMVVAELENPPKYFIIPEEFGKWYDVTNDIRFKNVYISQNGLPDREEFYPTN